MEFTEQLLNDANLLTMAGDIDDEIKSYIYRYNKDANRNCIKGAIIYSHPLLGHLTDNEVDEMIIAISVDYPFMFRWAFNLENGVRRLVVLW